MTVGRRMWKNFLWFRSTMGGGVSGLTFMEYCIFGSWAEDLYPGQE